MKILTPPTKIHSLKSKYLATKHLDRHKAYTATVEPSIRPISVDDPDAVSYRSDWWNLVKIPSDYPCVWMSTLCTACGWIFTHKTAKFLITKYALPPSDVEFPHYQYIRLTAAIYIAQTEGATLFAEELRKEQLNHLRSQL